MMNSTQTDPSSKLKAQASLQSITQNHHHQIWPPAFYVHQQPIPELLSAEEDEEEEHRRSSREHMFEKPLTPSDVGKLNRLVIPKQHAEKYFSLSSTDSAEKGFLLSFEDESGKPWRFRYSYWTSSQSYVLTKGWSRFVKEKRLDAGDIVTFQRLCFDTDKFFITCRRRSAPAHVSPAAHPAAHAFCHAHYPYSPLTPPPPPPPPPQLALSYHPDRCYMRDAAEPVEDGAAAPISIATPGNSKRLRLFGVNLDCQMDGPGPQGPECSGLSGHGLLASSWSSPL